MNDPATPGGDATATAAKSPNKSHQPKAPFAPRLAYTLQECSAAGAGGHTRLYEALRDGRLRARKRGRTTVVLHDDLMAYLAGLPEYSQAPNSPTSPDEGRTAA